MKNQGTREVLRYWDGLRKGRAVPERGDIEPFRLKRVLSSLFMLECFDGDHFVFRLAGTQLCELYGREFRAHNFLSLWRGTDRFRMRDFLTDALRIPAPGLILCRAETFDRLAIDMEVLVLPIADRSKSVCRLLGCMQAVTNPDILGSRRLVNQWILELRHIDPAREPELVGGRKSERKHLRLIVSRPDA